MKQPTLGLFRWQPAAPRTLRVVCAVCGLVTVNEDRRLQGWEQSVRPPRVYRCKKCTRKEAP